MNKIKFILRILLTPIWLGIFILYFIIYYIRMSWKSFYFGDYWDHYLIVWDKVMIFLKIN